MSKNDVDYGCFGARTVQQVTQPNCRTIRFN